MYFLGLFGSREKLLLANLSGDPEQTPHHAASDLGRHCLPMYPFLGVPDNNGLNKFECVLTHWQLNSRIDRETWDLQDLNEAVLIITKILCFIINKVKKIIIIIIFFP